MMWFSTSIIAKRAFTRTPEVWSSVLANLPRWMWNDCSFGPLLVPPPIPDQSGAIRYGWMSPGSWRHNPCTSFVPDPKREVHLGIYGRVARDTGAIAQRLNGG